MRLFLDDSKHDTHIQSDIINNVVIKTNSISCDNEVSNIILISSNQFEIKIGQIENEESTKATKLEHIDTF